MGCTSFSFCASFIILLSFPSFPESVLSDNAQIYIIAVRRPADATAATSEALKDYYCSFLPKTASAGFNNHSRLLYTYEQAFIGFAAWLTPEELEEVSKKDGFLLAHPDRTVPLLTTRTPAFLGLQLGSGLWGSGGGGGVLGEGIVIGMIDTGFTPGHPSFDDAGMPPPPHDWKGTCEKNVCNKKVIGARSFAGDIKVDNVGHGTHTASTAAGAFVHGANLLGQANGTAAGMAPRAHLAIYKACDSSSCALKDVTAALDAAVKDGVDVISISLGGPSTLFFNDPVAIGTLAAVEKGIFVSLAGGNEGPHASSLSNEAPWMLTVAASTLDRSLRVTVGLSNGQELPGEALYQPAAFPKSRFSLVSTNDCPRGNIPGAKGAVVLCEGGSDVKLSYLKSRGAIAVIIMNIPEFGETVKDTPNLDLPTARVSFAVGTTILKYLNSTKAPAVSLRFEGTVLGVKPAPVMGYFSSRGPSTVNPYVMKPDITGPGVNVLAAWSRDPLGATQFKIAMGTSMATPHLAGIAALLKKAHPDWSPAAIKSAIMTTSNATANDGERIKTEQLCPGRFYDTGAGHVNPESAADPGLVYDLDADAYIRFLCGLDYTNKQVSAIARRRVDCESAGRIAEWDLNYPSISLFLKPGRSTTVNRVVTNVGPAKVTYTAVADEVPGLVVTVTPKTLQFTDVNEKKSFSVTFTLAAESGKETAGSAEGNLRWISGKYVVRSPFYVDVDAL